jgi:hypothetical protein
MENKMTNNSNQIPICIYSSRKTEKKLCKESIKKDTKDDQVIEQKGNRPYQQEEGKFLGRYAEKRETGQGCRLRS